MVVNFDKSVDENEKNKKNNVTADVIILGCSLPGVVTAYKLKTRFGDAMDIVVLDLGNKSKPSSLNVTFFTDTYKSEPDDDEKIDSRDNYLDRHLVESAKEFNVPFPEASISPDIIETSLKKIFQHTNGKVTDCLKQYCDFDYLNYLEKFELTQYQNALDVSMKSIFRENILDPETEKKKLLYYDKTNMETHICTALIFPTSREIMRIIVRLVCGVPTTEVSVLFYLHQCRRNNNVGDHLGDRNLRLREKILGYFRKKLQHEIRRSVADITISTQNIENIRTYSEQRVIVETLEEKFIGNLVALALKPNELTDIVIESELLVNANASVAKAMTPGRAKKFIVQYEENFWQTQGYSGDILSVRGPIIWAMQRPRMSGTGSVEKYPSLVGYLMTTDENESSESRVIEQLVKLFGEEAATPVGYKESDIADIFVPHCGDFVALRKLVLHGTRGMVQWGALDIFADGDIEGALEAGHKAYLRLTSCLRPQAQQYEEVSFAQGAVSLSKDDPVSRFLCTVNYISAMQSICVVAAVYVGYKVISNWLKR